MEVKVNKKVKSATDEELQSLSKEELITKIRQLEAHNVQLKSIVQKSLKSHEEATHGKATKKHRPFDFSKCFKRHILLRLYYLGWDYQGFAAQEDSIETIEHHLFAALKKVCLIEGRETSNYNRCGRTDKGVSAFCQVISLDVRSKFSPEEQLEESNLEGELDYCSMLNRVLPVDIRCIAWMPMVNPAYSARFDCRSRTYRYFFPQGDLNVPLMEEGARYLVGVHDFRNFCKMDVGNGVVNFVRSIDAISIQMCQEDYLDNESYNMLCVELTGKAFLWHQVRCIMAVLLLVGQGKEEPSVVKELLDVEKNPCKPQYSMAIDVPLNLYKCQFNEKSIQPAGEEQQESDGGSDLRNWIFKHENVVRTICELQGLWMKQNVKSTMIRDMLHELERVGSWRMSGQATQLTEGVKSKEYRPLLQRQQCESLENRIEHYAKKRRIEVSTKSNDSNADGSDEPMQQSVADDGTNNDGYVDHGVTGIEN
ncbi:tRNA pseudouridine(38/39) synthase [Anopheles marshallii]|uniref:tRNA pseudouridine(38/39) synthase n=1 Tax=Anopheles marshallii TaxID=1521116 RepID=UPI00237B0F05|nr:tRNA pseudouridine(38/39) synthase [Anopheles marshallii]